jgi:hypothetical protein
VSFNDEEMWESRDRKVNKRRNIKYINKNYTPTSTKKVAKPRVIENRKLSELDLDEIFSLDE